MNATDGNSVSLTADDAIQKTQMQLNEAMIAFDRWVSQNPLLTNPSNVVYRTQRQNIKLLRLRLRELEQLKNEYQNRLVLLTATEPTIVDSNIPKHFTRSRNDKTPVVGNNGTPMRLGRKPTTSRVSSG